MGSAIPIPPASDEWGPYPPGGSAINKTLDEVFKGARAAESEIDRNRQTIHAMHAQNVRYHDIIVAYEQAAFPVPLDEWVGPIE